MDEETIKLNGIRRFYRDDRWLSGNKHKIKVIAIISKTLLTEKKKVCGG